MIPDTRTAPHRLIAMLAAYGVGGGLVTLLGWAANVPILTAWKGDDISMFPNAAVGTIAAGAALLFALRRGATAITASRVLASLVLGVGALTLLEHLTGANFGIDTLLFDRSWGQAAATSPMRMGVPASLSFVLLGSGLLLLTHGEKARGAAVALGLAVLALSMLSLTGHLYGAEQMFMLPRLTAIAMQTATMIFALALAIVMSVPEREPMRVMLEDSAASILARRTLPLILVFALVLGWGRVTLQNMGLVDTAFGTALRTLVEMLMLIGVLWRAMGLIRAHEKALHETEAEVRRQAMQLSTFLETAAIALQRVGADGRILWANDAELRMLGYSSDEYVGHHISEFHMDPDQPLRLLDRLRNGENVREAPARMRCKDGSVKSVLIDSTGLWENGEFLHTQDFMRDVTEQIRSEETRMLLSAIVGASDDAIISMNLDGIVTSWNAGAMRMFGYTEKEAVGQSILLIIPPDRHHEEQELLGRIRRGIGIEHYETVRRTKSGQLLDISLTVSPMHDASGRIIGASKIGRDITDRKKAEVEREEASRRKDEFIAILAHELRNPLAPVRNAAFYLKSLSSPEVQKPVEMIERQVAQMSRLIDDLLDISRISRGVLELRRDRVRAAEIIEAAVDASRAEFESRHHALETHAPDRTVELIADRERLVQVLSNLLGNAAKYTPIGGRIRLDVEVSGNMLEILLKDSGIGIPKDKLGEIFELFARIDQSLERQGGLGIGLTLARQIVELHGGTIVARSEGVGHGSEFVVRLPIVVAPRLAADASSATNGKRSVARRVLVADDNHDAAESLAMLLQFAGHDVHTAFDGEAAFLTAEAVQPDVALLDIGMPKANGYQVAERIRNEAWGDRICLVALTGWGQEADKRRAKAAGFDLHLLKPVSPETIEQLLADLPG